MRPTAISRTIRLIPDSASLIDRYPLVVLRSFSKIYGLAGLRVGFALSREGVVEYMNRVREPFNVNQLAQAAALAALEDDDYKERAIALVRRGKGSALCWRLRRWDSNTSRARPILFSCA